MLRDRLGVGRLVVLLLVEADGERAHASVRLRLHERDDGRGIDPSGEERAERNVGDHAPARCIAQQEVELIQRLRLADRVIARPVDDLREAPVALDLRHAVRTESQHRARLQLVHVAEDGGGARHVAVAHEGGRRFGIDRAAPGGMRHQRLQLGAEQQMTVDERPIERLDAETVADEVQRAGLPVP